MHMKKGAVHSAACVTAMKPALDFGFQSLTVKCYFLLSGI